ncbi:MAG TPA: hypothetical protein VGF62_02150 [Rhizomicrobium sp.]
MPPLFRSRTFSSANIVPRLFNLAIRMLAHLLNMPEPLVHDTGIFMFAQVQAVENKVGKNFCPVRLWRRLPGWLRVNRHCEPTGRANARPMTGSAKQSIRPCKERMDCFVAYAPRNDVEIQLRDLAACPREVCSYLRPSEFRGRRECRARAAPAASHAK